MSVLAPWPALQAQTATDLNEGFQLTKDSATEVFTLSWWGRTDRTYFVQTSTDLMNWSYLPLVESGAEAVDGIQFTNTAERQFWRLRHTNAPTGGNTETADFDGDGLENLEELNAGLDPFDPDSDGDGYYDGQEQRQNTDPLNAASTPAEKVSSLEDPGMVERPFFLFEQHMVVNNEWWAGGLVTDSTLSWFDDNGESGQETYEGATPRWEGKLTELSFPETLINSDPRNWRQAGNNATFTVSSLYQSEAGGVTHGQASVTHRRVGMACDPAGPPQPWQVVRRFFSYRKTTPYFNLGTKPKFSALQMKSYSIAQGQHTDHEAYRLVLGKLGEPTPISDKEVWDHVAHVYLFPHTSPLAYDGTGLETWVTLPAGGPGVQLWLGPYIGGDNLSFQVVGDGISPQTSTSDSPFWSATYSASTTVPAVPAALHIALDNGEDMTVTPEPLLKFDVKPPQNLTITVQPIGLVSGGILKNPNKPPTQEELKTYLDSVFVPQANVHTTVNYRTQVNVAFDVGLGPKYPGLGVDGALSILQGAHDRRGLYSEEENAILTVPAAAPVDEPRHITIYWVAGGIMNAYGWQTQTDETAGKSGGLNFVTCSGHAGKAMASYRRDIEPIPRVIWIAGSHSEISMSYQNVLWLFAHELGHALGDMGHTIETYSISNGVKSQQQPPSIGGFSPFSDNASRLMTNMRGLRRYYGPKLLNKVERDLIQRYFLPPQ